MARSKKNNLKELLVVGKKYQAEFESIEDSSKFEKDDFEILAIQGNTIVVFAFGLGCNEKQTLEILRKKRYTASELFESKYYEDFEDDENGLADCIDESVVVYTIKNDKLVTCLGFEIRNIVEKN